MDTRTRAWRVARDRRYNRRWWTVFFGGCFLVLALLATNDGFNVLPWLILGGLLGMILGRRRHHREQLARDNREDEEERQRWRAKAAPGVLGPGRKDEQGQGGSAGDEPSGK